MGTVIFFILAVVGLLGLIALAFAFASAFGRFVKRNEQRAYVAAVMHAVEVRAAFDMEERAW